MTIIEVGVGIWQYSKIYFFNIPKQTWFVKTSLAGMGYQNT
jgi:hypothetical protein